MLYNDERSEGALQTLEAERAAQIARICNRLALVRQNCPFNIFVLVYIFCNTLKEPVYRDVELKLACMHNADYNKSSCDALRQYPKEMDVQELRNVHFIITDAYAWLKPSEELAPLLIIMYIAYFGDMFKIRKPFFLVPIAGEIIGCLSCIICDVTNANLKCMLILTNHVPNIFGGTFMFRVAISSHILEQSGNKFFYLVSLMVMVEMVTAATHSISGILYQTFGTLTILPVVIVILIANIIFGVYWIQDHGYFYKQYNCKSVIIDILCPRYLLYSIRVLFVRRVNNNRLMVWTLLFIIFITSGSIRSEGELLFLYANYNVHWTVFHYSLFSCLLTFCTLIATGLMMIKSGKATIQNDFWLIISACASKIISNTLPLIMAGKNTLYVFAVLQLFHPVWIFGVQAICFRYVQHDDLNKMHALVSMAIIASKSVFVPIYCKFVYEKYFDGFHRNFFVAGSIAHSVTIILTILTYGMHRLIQYLYAEIISLDSDDDDLSY